MSLASFVRRWCQPFRAPANPLLLDPVWAAADRAEREARRRHQSVRHIQTVKRDRVHLGLSGAAGR